MNNLDLTLVSAEFLETMSKALYLERVALIEQDTKSGRGFMEGPMDLLDAALNLEKQQKLVDAEMERRF